MPFLVRKIDYAKWNQKDALNGGVPSADAITSCMRTSGNKLSLWSITDDSQIEEAVLAIVACNQNLDAIDVLSIDPSLIEQKGLAIESSPGTTPYVGFRDNHRNVIELDYCSLGTMAQVFVDSICQGRRRRITRAELKTILSKAVETHKVKWSELKATVQKDIERPAESDV